MMMKWLTALFAMLMFIAAMAAAIEGARRKDPGQLYAVGFYVATGLAFLALILALREDKKL